MSFVRHKLNTCHLLFSFRKIVIDEISNIQYNRHNSFVTVGSQDKRKNTTYLLA